MKIAAILIVLGLCRVLLADDWKPAGSPLMTRWAKDVTPENVHAEYPRPQMVRKEWQNLNGLWDFTAGNGEKGKILVPFPVESALSGVGKHYDKLTYRRTFKVPAEWKGKRVLLHFGAVDYETVVSLNGKELGKHVGGYDAFSFDITDALKGDGEQELVVDVSDKTAETQARGKQHPNPHGIWYVPSTGIWQTVWLEPVAVINSIEAIKITPDVDAGTVAVDASVGRTTRDNYHPDLVVEVLDGEKVIATGGRSKPIKIDAPKLWSPESPHLYTLRVKTDRDEIRSYFGMRKIEVSPDEKGVPRIKLNGQSIMQVGPLDQGYWPDGNLTPPTDEALKFDIEFAKKVGFNMLRKHVKIESQRFYYHCDKLGILVWQDMPNAMTKEPGEWQQQFEKELTAMVEQHINSPSIIMWVPLNEGWGQEPYGKEGTIRLVELVRKLDPTRLINNASGWTDSGAGDVNDIHSYPGPAAPPIEKKRAIVLGEFGGLGLPIEGHLWQKDKNWGYANMQSRDQLTDRYVRLLGRLWQLNDDSGLCAGVYTQTTDVEGEVNGLLTYDRAVMKLDEGRVREANLGQGPRIEVTPLIATARQQPAEWKYTFEKPADGWEKPEFDESKWKTGPSGFGTQGTPNATIGTTWNTPDIWLRREIEIPAVDDAELFVHHDEACEIFINGVRAARLRGFTSDYIEHRLRDQARAALKPGRNLIAVHVNQTGGGQYFDLGFVRLVEKRER